MPFSRERIERVYDDGSGEYIQVRPDAEGIALMEIAYYNEKGEKHQLLLMSHEQARLVAQAILELCNEGEPK